MSATMTDEHMAILGEHIVNAMPSLLPKEDMQRMVAASPAAVEIAVAFTIGWFVGRLREGGISDLTILGCLFEGEVPIIPPVPDGLDEDQENQYAAVE